MRKKLILILLLLLNFYFFSFFVYFKPLHTGYLTDMYKPLSSGGPEGVSVFVPFYTVDDRPAGVVTRSIWYCYLPMIVIWEKKGVGVYCVDLLSFGKLLGVEFDYGPRFR